MHPKSVQVTLGPTEYTLFYNLNAFCLLRDIGVDAFSLTPELMQDPRTIRALLWAGVQKYHPGTSLDAIGDALDLSDLGDAAGAFTEALRKASAKEIAGPQ